MPLLASIAFLTPETKHIEHQTNWTSIAIALGAVVGLVVAGKWLMNPIFRLISKAHIREMMTAARLACGIRRRLSHGSKRTFNGDGRIRCWCDAFRICIPSPT